MRPGGTRVVSGKKVMRCHLPRVGGGGGAAVVSVAEGPVHAEGDVEEPCHGGDEAEGEDGAPDVAPVGAPAEPPDPVVPEAAAAGAQLPQRVSSDSFRDLPASWSPNGVECPKGHVSGDERINVHSLGAQTPRST